VTDPETPRAAGALAKKLELDPDWRVRVIPGHGGTEFGGLSEDTNGEGKRHRVSEYIEVDSVSVRAQHTDGRALVAVWIKRADEQKWTFDLAFRGRDVATDEGVPRRLNSRQLNAYAIAGCPADALAACAELAPKAGSK
jgi:hypothetical protein